VEIDDVNIDESRMESSIDKLKKWRDRINERLDEEFENHKKRARKIHPQGVRVIDYLQDYTMRGGKRVRPALMIAGYMGVGGENFEKALPASLSIEALQSYLLIHDDIMDEDELRRGESTLHKMYEEYHKKEFNSGRAEKFGENMGITVGDISNSFAVNQLIQSDFPPEVKLKALAKFEQVHRHTGYGQALDITFNQRSVDDVTEKDVLTVHRLKTAQYTMAGPLVIGAILGEGNEEQKEMLNEYGLNVGKAFQVYDDMLGLFGNEEKLGKPVDSDLKEGKRTLLILKALENGDGEQRKVIMNALGNEDVTQEQVEEVREIVKDTGSYDYSQKMTAKFVRKGKEALDKDIIDPEIVDFLMGLADYIITREV
jgi:geranylgeranyl diphosphate synthase type I